MLAGDKKAPLASLDDFSSICYYSPSMNKKASECSTPLLKDGNGTDNNKAEITEANDNVENIAKCNANRKLRPLVKVPGDRLVAENQIVILCVWEGAVFCPVDLNTCTFLDFSYRFNIVYLILIIHGVGTLMPWNMFITAKSVSL
jgi:hypothetical protein